MFEPEYVNVKLLPETIPFELNLHSLVSPVTPPDIVILIPIVEVVSAKAAAFNKTLVKAIPSFVAPIFFTVLTVEPLAIRIP